MSAVEISNHFTEALSFFCDQLGLLCLSLKDKQVLDVKVTYKKRDAFVWLPAGYKKSFVIILLHS